MMEMQTFWLFALLIFIVGMFAGAAAFYAFIRWRLK